MLGPSLPSESPPPMAAAAPRNLAISTCSQFALILPCSSPSTCGMPLPEISGSRCKRNATKRVRTTSRKTPRNARLHLCATPSRNRPRISSALSSVQRKAELTIPASNPTATPSRMRRYLKFSCRMSISLMRLSFLRFSDFFVICLPKFTISINSLSDIPDRRSHRCPCCGAPVHRVR